ncbi:T-cell differentiation antigen CD6 isoform X3 [Strongylocentrotus purpuratus]|uniref:SRCR domain-containing protein n=1 Tax=Strongylocentrotus purpuratus TaxID=7668 RepID=A0A7M7NN40_STRPU|nr:T-cell differentiation antigen CD6 isoform X3 [Strongylocentrotus purpuratus]
MASVERFTVLITLVLVAHCGEHIVNGVISDVRLVDGPTSNKGTVEIRQNNGTWETTCGINLGINDVIVICRQLGFARANIAITDTPYGQNSTPTGGLQCNGDEDNLAGCTLVSNGMCSTAGAASCHVNIQSPTTPGVGSTDSMQIMTLSPASASASASPPVMTTMGTSQVPPRNGDNQNNTGLYAGVAGGVVAIVIIVVIVIVVVLLMRKRSRRQQKDGLQSHDMTVMQPASPNGTQDNLYHDMFQDNSDETPHGLQLPDPPTDGDVTYYSSVRDHALPEGDATSYSSVKDQKSKNTDSKLNNTMPSDQNDGFPEKRVSRPPPNGDVEAMYAMPDKPRKSQGEEDFGSLYAKPDKTGKGGDGQGSEDFGALYAMPDKSRGVPEGREDVNQVGPESEGNSGEGLYSLADDDTGLYAMSTAPGHTVSNDDNEYGTVMVDNELYAM